MSVYGIGTGYFAWQATVKIQKNTAGTDFADMIANKETKKREFMQDQKRVHRKRMSNV